MRAERGGGVGGVILNRWRNGFVKSQSIVVFTRSNTAPSRVQVMPKASNITAYLARIYIKHIYQA